MQYGTTLTAAPIDMTAAACVGHSTHSLQCSLDRGFEVELARDLNCQLTSLEHVHRSMVVMSPTVHRLYGAQIEQTLRSHDIQSSLCVLPMGERRKTLRTVTKICNAADSFHLGRRDTFIAVGGGVCSDLVSLAASMYRRGVQHVRIPTTLIGQVDAAIGIKGGVNYHHKKNLLGCFHPPRAVIINSDFLSTLSASHIRQGLAEILKMALVVDRGLFETIQRHGPALIESRFQNPRAVAERVIEHSIGLLLDELQQNPYEDLTLQRLLDMGHTFSPALEAASRFRLTHGEAVAIDMALTCMIAESLGLILRSEAETFVSLLCRLDLPVHTPLLTVELCKSAARAATDHRGGKLHLVVPTRIGAAQFAQTEAVEERVLLRALARVRELSFDLREREVRPTTDPVQRIPDASPAL